jgi:hypothetical protein
MWPPRLARRDSAALPARDRPPAARASGNAGLACAAGQGVGQGELPVFEHERAEVTRVEQLDLDVRIQLAQATQLAVLLADQLLAERRHLEVQVQLPR